ncbi:MAG: rod shape-determining protein MreC [Candidatus Paceibacterota bacterium]
MTYLLPHSSPARRRSRVFWTISIIVVLIVLFISWRAPHTFPSLMTAVARPFWRMSFSIQSGALRSPAELLKDNEELKFQLDSLKQNIASSTIGAILVENQELKAMFYRASTTPFKLAAVLARPPFMPYDELIIDLGADDGISTTTRVYAPGNILIGRAVEVLSQTSKIALYSSPGERYNVLIGANHVPATAVGQGGGQYRADVPHGTALLVGDAVNDPSLSNGPLGVIVSLATDPADPFDTIIFTPQVNIYSLRWVMVDARPAAKLKK